MKKIMIPVIAAISARRSRRACRLRRVVFNRGGGPLLLNGWSWFVGTKCPVSVIKISVFAHPVTEIVRPVAPRKCLTGGRGRAGHQTSIIDFLRLLTNDLAKG